MNRLMYELCIKFISNDKTITGHELDRGLRHQWCSWEFCLYDGSADSSSGDCVKLRFAIRGNVLLVRCLVACCRKFLFRMSTLRITFFVSEPVLHWLWPVQGCATLCRGCVNRSAVSGPFPTTVKLA